MTDSPRLIGTPLSPVPAGAQAAWVAGEGVVRLRAALFPVERPLGSVILSPGRTEPIEKYFEVVEELRERGYVVLVHDWRGHGLSTRLHKDARRGHAVGAGPFLADYARLLQAYEERLPRPWIGLGHSMGGGLTALALAEGVGRLDAAMLCAPMMGVQVGKAPVALARALAAGFSRIGAGGFYAGGGGEPTWTFENNILTHDRGRWDRVEQLLIQAPELQIGGVTWSWLAFAFELADRLAAARLEAVAAPVTAVVAGEEQLVDNAATRAFVARLPNGRCVEATGARHEILMETDPVRALFWSEFDALAARVTSPPA